VFVLLDSNVWFAALARDGKRSIARLSPREHGFCDHDGELLKQAVEAGFDVLITMDSNMVHQQNLAKYPIAVVALRAASKSIG
jgi:predicted nucleic acid-binding protein